jgi:hypothetical protein
LIGGKDMEYVDFNNDYCVDYAYGKPSDDDDKLREVYIDGYPENPDEEGTVIAKVILTKHRDVIIDWHHNGYRMNETVKNLIRESIVIIKDDDSWQ